MSGFREAIIDTDAMTHNIRHLARIVKVDHIIAVVKADGYGHGAVPAARAALAGGADWLATADLDEALALRDAGITAPLLCWLHAPDTDFRPARERGIDIGVSSLNQLNAVMDAGGDTQAQVHLKLETGLSRNGIDAAEWQATFARAAELEREGHIHVRGIFSHLSNTSDADDLAAATEFAAGVRLAEENGLRPELVHLAATAAAIRLPQTRFNTVRIGIGLYGLSPFDDADSSDLGLVPAMTLRASVAAVRRVPAGKGVSYSYTYRTTEESTLALVPLGYADGIPRQASSAGPVTIGGQRHTVAGRIAMDQFVVDVGNSATAPGDDVVIFGDPSTGVPSATEWANAAGTINYEVVTRIGARVPRVYRTNS
ncbi:alanine racemase [Mycetocola zhadangensis]|uniref:Alanine racemase n=1 Tax=Mycetocola zhadangensis TaxID=1164595 RepID=A0A3L7J532_9MICO|nr:alanine racemase [Mycetocola zhadangensis]RLQ85435.1 alanine racemase [Mycetocola zhadangensis]GGE82535.1 alanine racemase [Mycetocola zhadangensis]